MKESELVTRINRLQKGGAQRRLEVYEHVKSPGKWVKELQKAAQHIHYLRFLPLSSISVYLPDLPDYDQNWSLTSSNPYQQETIQ